MSTETRGAGLFLSGTGLIVGGPSGVATVVFVLVVLSFLGSVWSGLETMRFLRGIEKPKTPNYAYVLIVGLLLAQAVGVMPRGREFQSPTPLRPLYFRFYQRCRSVTGFLVYLAPWFVSLIVYRWVIGTLIQNVMVAALDDTQKAMDELIRSFKVPFSAPKSE